MENIEVEKLIERLLEQGTDFGLRVIAAIVVFVIGRMLAHLAARGVRRAMRRTTKDETLTGFVSSLVRLGIVAFTVIAVLDRLGVETASFAVVLGAAGLAVGFALQGSLSNFASGVMLLIFRPFAVGDFIEAGGTSGSVQLIGIFTTTLHTADNKKVIVPNSQIMSGTITNYSANDTRRIDLVAGIGYADDIDRAKAVLERILAEDPRILDDPAPVVEVAELADSSVNFAVRPWVRTGDYWPVRFAVLRRIKEEFDRAGISIPFPQRDVHLYSAVEG